MGAEPSETLVQKRPGGGDIALEEGQGAGRAQGRARPPGLVRVTQQVDRLAEQAARQGVVPHVFGRLAAELEDAPDVDWSAVRPSEGHGLVEALGGAVMVALEPAIPAASRRTPIRSISRARPTSGVSGFGSGA